MPLDIHMKYPNAGTARVWECVLKALAQGEIGMRIKCVRFSFVPPRHAKLASHRDARCAHRTWAGRLLRTMTQNDLFCCGISMRIRCCHFCVVGTISNRFPMVKCARHRDKPEQASSDPASCVYPTSVSGFACRPF